MSSVPLKPWTRRARVGLLVPLLALSLTNCAGVAAIERPGSDRTTPVDYPTIPDGEAPCPADADARCLSDSQNASLLRAYDAALTKANDKLQWLADYLAGFFK